MHINSLDFIVVVAIVVVDIVFNVVALVVTATATTPSTLLSSFEAEKTHSKQARFGIVLSC